MDTGGGHGLEVFSTSPQSKDVPRDEYLRRVQDVARWSEEAGCRGILVYTDNGIVDPWLVAQAIVTATESLAPLVALQPVYMHPYSAAKMVTSLAYLHGRRVHLNFLAGGFRNDLVALGDETPHDERYDRTVEYATIMTRLLSGDVVTLEGRYYTVRNLRLAPSLPPELFPGLMTSGSSPAGLEAARAIGATAIRYPRPAAEEASSSDANGVALGIRVGIVARDDAGEAWSVARERFPADRKGQIQHGLAMKVSDSSWHRQLAELEREGDDPDDPYWLEPFRNSQTFCPYLVGSYERVGQELRRYVDAGFETVVLDIPPSREELDHVGSVLAEATRDRRA